MPSHKEVIGQVKVVSLVGEKASDSANKEGLKPGDKRLAEAVCGNIKGCGGEVGNMMSNNELYDQIHTQWILKGKESYLDKPTLLREILDYLEREIPLDSKILELGCGGGHLAHYLQSKGYDVLPTDASQVALDVAKSNYPDLKLRLVDAENMLLEDNSFDVVIAIEVIEHLPRLHEHIREARRVLKTDGTYIIKTPNKWLDTLFYRLYRIRAKRKNIGGEHVSLCSIGDLRKMLTENGFSTTFLKQKRLTQTQVRKLRLLMSQVVAGITVPLLNLLLTVVPLSFMPSIICIARKERRLHAQGASAGSSKEDPFSLSKTGFLTSFTPFIMAAF